MEDTLINYVVNYQVKPFLFYFIPPIK